MLTAIEIAHASVPRYLSSFFFAIFGLFEIYIVLRKRTLYTSYRLFNTNDETIEYRPKPNERGTDAKHPDRDLPRDARTRNARTSAFFFSVLTLPLRCDITSLWTLHAIACSECYASTHGRPRARGRTAA